MPTFPRRPLFGQLTNRDNFARLRHCPLRVRSSRTTDSGPRSRLLLGWTLWEQRSGACARTQFVAPVVQFGARDGAEWLRAFGAVGPVSEETREASPSAHFPPDRACLPSTVHWPRRPLHSPSCPGLSRSGTAPSPIRRAKCCSTAPALLPRSRTTRCPRSPCAPRYPRWSK